MNTKAKEMIETHAVRMPTGTGARIDKVLLGGELRSAFVRSAIIAELQRRESERKKRKIAGT